MVDVIALNPMHGGYLERMDLFRQPWIRCSAVIPAGARHDRRANLVELKRRRYRSKAVEILTLPRRRVFAGKVRQSASNYRALP